MFDILKDTQNSSSPLFNVAPSLEKLCQAMVARNDRANLGCKSQIWGQAVQVTLFWWLIEGALVLYNSAWFFDIVL